MKKLLLLFATVFLFSSFALGQNSLKISPSAGTPGQDGCFRDENGLCVNLYVKSSASGTGTNAQQVQGTAATGAAPVGNPVQAGWMNSSGNMVVPSCIVESASVCTTTIGNGNTPAAGTSNIVNFPATAGGSQGPWGTLNYTSNGTTLDPWRSIINSTDSPGAGIAAVGLVAQFDDVAPSTMTENQFGNARMDARRRIMVTTVQPTTFNCVVPVSTATTIQAVGAGCAAPGAGLSLYITDIKFDASASGIAADAFPTLKSGTGGTCGTGTAVIWQFLSAAAVNAVDNRTQPIKVAANNEICWINTTAGSKAVQIGGYIAP